MRSYFHGQRLIVNYVIHTNGIVSVMIQSTLWLDFYDTHHEGPGDDVALYILVSLKFN